MDWKSPETPPSESEQIGCCDGFEVVTAGSTAWLVRDNWSVELPKLNAHLGFWDDDDDGPDVRFARAPECYIVSGNGTIEGMTAGSYVVRTIRPDGYYADAEHYFDGGDAQLTIDAGALLYVYRTSR